MSQNQLLLLLFRISLIVDVAAVFLFVGVYSYLSPWRKNPIGRTLVYLDILLACAVTPSLLSLFFHFSRLTSHVAAWIDIGLFALIGMTLLARIPLWVRLHLNKSGHHSYEGMPQFIAQVIRRRGRPIWKDEAEAGLDGGDAAPDRDTATKEEST